MDLEQFSKHLAYKKKQKFSALERGKNYPGNTKTSEGGNTWNTQLQREGHLSRQLLKYSQEADQMGYQVYEVKGDGNCYYRCISKFLYGNEKGHKEVRNRIMQEMKQNKNIYSQLIDDDIDRHIVEHSKETTWATESEIYATANEFLFKISVLTLMANRWQWLTYETIGLGICDKARYYRLIKEHDWMIRLNTIIPNGLSIKSNVGIL